MRFGFILAHKVYNRSVLRIIQYKNKHFLDLKNYFKLFFTALIVLLRNGSVHVHFSTRR